MRKRARNAWARLIVDAIAERLEVQGYRSGTGDVEAERRAWEVLQANRVDADQRQVHTEALTVGRSYAMVAGERGDPVVTPETAREVTHVWAPGRRVVAAALKAFELEPDLWRVELYRPDAVFVWVHDRLEGRKADGVEGDLFDLLPVLENQGRSVEWIADEFRADENPLEAVPVVPFENRPAAATGPLGELADLVPVLARIDDLTLDMLVAAHFAAFRQKWATGIEVPRDKETGNPIEPYKAAVQRLWVSEDSEAKFGSFDATPLAPYIEAIDAHVAELAAISRVPAHYLMQSNLANPPSAESLVASESGLVQKVRDRQRGFGESWEQVVRLAHLVDGNADRAADRSSEIVWRDPQVRHPAQVADAAVKYAQVGVPREAVWATLGITPQELERWRALAAQDLLELAAAGLPPTPPPAADAG